MSDHDDGTPVPKIREHQHIEWLSETVDPIVDLRPYRKQLKDIDLSDEEADAFLAILWNIMSHFVDLGFGVDAVSLVEHLTSDRCGKATGDSRRESGSVLSSDQDMYAE